ncbi:MAG: hypothetical protein ABI112_18210, partial [Terracoccus sp.]
MDNAGSLLERLRQQLADLESNQRATGGTATAGFWSTPSPDAAEPGPSDAGPSGAADESQPAREFPEPLTIHWANWSKVGGACASGFAFAAASLDRPQLEPHRMSEPDLLESVTQLGAVQHHKEVNLVRLVTQLEARAVASPGGLSRVDWLRQVDPTLTASAAKAVVTCGAAFNQPRWAQLRAAVTGETSTDSTASSTDCADGADGPGGSEATPDSTEDGSSGGRETSPDPHTDRVTVGKAAQVIDFFHRLTPVADPDDLHQAVTHLTEQAAGLRWEQL